MASVVNNNPMEDFVDKFLQYAASGDISKVEYFTKGSLELDVTNEKGWTALMFSARNGHSNVAKLLVEKGCDVTKINSSGQTALDIAKFWNHADVIDLLEKQREPNSHESYRGLPNQGMNNFFAHNPLDRANHRRKEKDWLDITMKKANTKWCLFSNLNAYVTYIPDHGLSKSRESTKLLTVSYVDISKYVQEHEPVVLFLGLEHKDKTSALHHKSDDEAIAWFAVDASSLSEEAVKQINPQADVSSEYRAALNMKKQDAGILAQARSMLAWHDRYSFCPTCGSKTRVDEAGYKRTCVDTECRSNKGIHNTSYPRTDPTVIMAVISPDLKNILFGRSQRHPTNMWSCLAGFMEPGESIEDAVRRETLEEAGIKVGRVEYHSCQPWPMPSTLMIGCLGFAETEDIQIDTEELSDARWFSRKEAVQMLTKQHPQGLFCPPDQAIAHQLIKAWVHMTSNL